MKRLLFFALLIASCSNSDDVEPNEQSLDPIIGDWTIIESGGALSDGETFKEEMPCSNSQKLYFYEDNLFELEIWWGNASGGCEFDRVQDGEWLKTTRSDFPNANYRLIYYEIPGYIDGETAYPNITFSGNTMTIRFDYEEGSFFQYIYRTYTRE
jgi:hypothetical protein